MTYPTRKEADESFDEKWQGKGINTIQIFGEIKSHISTLRKNDVNFLKEKVGEMRRKVNSTDKQNISVNESNGYNRAIADFLSLLTECEGKLK